MRYVAIINVPGYSPMDDDPPVFDEPADAWQYLADERRRGEDLDESTADYSELPAQLEERARAARGSDNPNGHMGSVYGNTPGYDGEHDQGLAYSVQEALGELPGYCH